MCYSIDSEELGARSEEWTTVKRTAHDDKNSYLIERVKTVPSYIHGGDIQTYIDRHGFAPLDLSANINPFGIPETVRAAMHKAVDNCTQYPDPFCRAARQAIGEREGVNPDFLYCGNGAADVLDRLAAVLKPRKVLLTAPTFAEYERTLTDAEIRVHNLRETDGFVLTERILDEISSDLDAVYLCNPNNPTGRTIEPSLLQEIVRKCAENNVKLVVDECFNDFLIDSEQHTLKDLLESNPNLIILRAYTKMYAVPGVRFGWCMTADAALIEKLYHAGQPWNVSVIAQACAVAAANEPTRAIETAKRIAEERRFLADGLSAHGLQVFPGEANFLLFRSNDTKLHEKLAEHGIMIRNCDNYRGLSAGYYRVAVKTREASERLLQEITNS